MSDNDSGEVQEIKPQKQKHSEATRYPKMLEQAVQNLRDAQQAMFQGVLQKAWGMTKGELDATMQSFRRLPKRITSFSKCIDLMSALIATRDKIDDKAAERMRPYVDAFKSVIDKVGEAEQRRRQARSNAAASEVSNLDRLQGAA